MATIEIKEWTMKDPLNCIGFNAGTCWGSPTDNLEKNKKRAIECIKSGHGRVEELPDVYVVIEGYSAKMMRELYTHIGGSPTRMQASTRYIDYAKGFKTVIPPKIESNPEALKIWNETIVHITEGMNKLKELEMPKEDYTNLLPLAYESKMIWKINLRTLINFMNMRLCSRAYWEIRSFANELKKALSEYSEEWKEIANALFVPKCIAAGYCIEKFTCGLRPKKEEIIK
ncbi:MAG: FAD-dependent thymidylate synthase [Treponema sp.]|nr:FAD-dependent thymidylate synthase [Treponema sp.]